MICLPSPNDIVLFRQEKDFPFCFVTKIIFLLEILVKYKNDKAMKFALNTEYKVPQIYCWDELKTKEAWYNFFIHWNAVLDLHVSVDIYFKIMLSSEKFSSIILPTP